MSRKGDCWDNAVAESFFASLKQERVYTYIVEQSPNQYEQKKVKLQKVT